jgi:rSAM/selenodomain-associated transferase 2
MRISVVIPTLNEATALPACLSRIRASVGIDECLVVDANSPDGTADVARAFEGVRVLVAPRGRASQLNVGARAASGEVLLFVHADTLIPMDYPARIRDALSDERVVGGACHIRTVAHPPPWWSGLLGLADLRSRYTRLPYGDQAIFVRRSSFEAVGGFPELRLMEDVALSRLLQQNGRMVTLPSVAEVSARRLVARPVHSVVVMNTFPFLYRLGVSTRTLERWYGSPR